MDKSHRAKIQAYVERILKDDADPVEARRQAQVLQMIECSVAHWQADVEQCERLEAIRLREARYGGRA